MVWRSLADLLPMPTDFSIRVINYLNLHHYVIVKPVVGQGSAIDRLGLVKRILVVEKHPVVTVIAIVALPPRGNPIHSRLHRYNLIRIMLSSAIVMPSFCQIPVGSSFLISPSLFVLLL